MSATQPHNTAAAEHDEHICIDGNCPCNHDRPEDTFSDEEVLAALEEVRIVNFQIGRLTITDGVREELGALGINPHEYLNRHQRGDWGDVSDGDRQANEDALRTGARIVSVYKVERLDDKRFYIITDGDDERGVRHATTILLPSEY